MEGQFLGPDRKEGSRCAGFPGGAVGGMTWKAFEQKLLLLESGRGQLLGRSLQDRRSQVPWARSRAWG